MRPAGHRRWPLRKEEETKGADRSVGARKGDWVCPKRDWVCLPPRPILQRLLGLRLPPASLRVSLGLGRVRDVFDVEDRPGVHVDIPGIDELQLDETLAPELARYFTRGFIDVNRQTAREGDFRA